MCPFFSNILRILTLILVVSCSPLFFTGEAHAGDAEALFDRLTEEEKIFIIDQIDEAHAAYTRGDFLDALSGYEEIYALFPHPSILYRLALSHERLGNDREAVEHYRRFLETSPESEDRGKVERTIDLIERRQQQAGTFLQVLTTPEGAILRIGSPDSPPRGETPLQLDLAPGLYEIYLEKEGHHLHRETVEVTRGQTVLFRASLLPISPETPPDQSSPPSLLLPIASVVLLGAGAFATYRSINHHQDRTRQEDELRLWRRENTREGNEEELQRRLDQIDQARKSSLTMGLIGGTALLSAASLTAFWLLQKPPEEPGPALAISPLPGGASLQFQTRF